MANCQNEGLAGPGKPVALFTGIAAFTFWATCLAQMDFVVDSLFSMTAAMLVIYLFHHKNGALRVIALVLCPVLLWTYFLPRKIKECSNKLARNRAPSS